MATRMKVAITFDRVDSAAGIALSNQFGTPAEDTGDTDTSIRGATPGLGAQRTLSWSAVDAPTAALMVKFGWDRASVRSVNLEKVLR
jgi:hypothetical protein